MDLKRYNSIIKSITTSKIKEIPEISVIVIAHEKRSEFTECIMMLINQTKVTKEIIFVNNGQKDSVFDIKQQHISKIVDKYVKLTILERRKKP